MTIKDPEVAPKSAELVVISLIVQNNTCPLLTLLVVTLNVPEAPSLIVDGVELKVTDAADMVTEALFATISPVILRYLIWTLKVSAPSSVASVAIGTLNVPVLLLIVNEPEVAPKSASTVLILSIVQNNVVPFVTLTVVSTKFPDVPLDSFITVGVVVNI